MSAAKRAPRSVQVFDIINMGLLLIIVAFTLYPIIYVISASFSDAAAVLSGEMKFFPKGFNLEAYKRVFVHKDIPRSYLNTVIYTALGTVLSLVLSTLAAYPLSRKDLKGRKFFIIVMTITMFFSGGIVPSYLVIKNLGIFNNILALILPRAISVYNVIIMRSYFEASIPWEIQEAAIVDGCSNFKMLIRIIVPLSSPVIAVLLLFYGVAQWNAYFDAMMYLTQRSLYPLSLIIREIVIQNSMSEMVQSASNSVQILQGQSIKYAVIIVASVPILILYPFVQKYFLKGIMVGAVKG